MDYKAFMAIDPAHLEREWLEQASRYMELVTVEADANRQVDLLKERLEIVEAQRGDGYRHEAEAADKKLTEKALAQALALDPEVQKAKAELRDAVYQQDIVSGARKAMEHRKAALESLVMMQLRNNRAEPIVAGERKADVEAGMAQVRREAHPVQGRRPQGAVPNTPTPPAPPPAKAVTPVAKPNQPPSVPPTEIAPGSEPW